MQAKVVRAENMISPYSLILQVIAPYCSLNCVLLFFGLLTCNNLQYQGVKCSKAKAGLGHFLPFAPNILQTKQNIIP